MNFLRESLRGSLSVPVLLTCLLSNPLACCKPTDQFHFLPSSLQRPSPTNPETKIRLQLHPQFLLPSYSSSHSLSYYTRHPACAQPNSLSHTHTHFALIGLFTSSPPPPSFRPIPSPSRTSHSHVLSWYPCRRSGDKALEPASPLRRSRCCRKYCILADGDGKVQAAPNSSKVHWTGGELVSLTL